MLLLGACGDSQPLPDIEATVEASGELAEASLVAPTAAPLPTYTPLLTYTPAAEPLISRQGSTHVRTRTSGPCVV